MDIRSDRRFRQIPWRDLLAMSPWERGHQLVLPLPWLLLSWWFASQEYWYLALPASFMFFLTGLRQVHDSYHYSLGWPRWVCHGVMAMLSLLMLGSMHAIQVTHLQHHRDCMGPQDLEGASARQSGWMAILRGPLFPLYLHRQALRIGHRRQRLWIWSELAVNLMFIVSVFFVLNSAVLGYHVSVMVVGECLTGFFAVWSVHHDCDDEGIFARTLRSPWKSALVYQLFFHLEHHLFPAVPTCHLSTLAARVDEVAPEWASHPVF